MDSGDARTIFLVGFMATGKSAVGRRLAELLGRPFLDLDEVIEHAADESIPDIFDRAGEEEFRRLEAAALHDVLDEHGGAVVATGGGAPCFGDNLARMRAAGLVVSLTAPLGEIARRVRAGDDGERPLFGGEDEVAALAAAREPIYRQAHATVSTEGRSVDEVARAVSRAVDAAAILPHDALKGAAVVALSERGYPVAVAPRGLDRLGVLARRALGRGSHRIGIVSDDNVASLYGDRVREILAGAGFEPTLVTIPAGEPSKSLAIFGRVCEELVAAGLDRHSAVVALGGGVVGDLAGFVASALYRGVACIQVPTTALAMVDSAIGGKTGVNIEAGKNLVGAFWQPRLVLADPDVLVTLPPRERRAAFGELVKYGLLDGEDLYAAVDDLADWASDGEEERVPAQVTEVIRRCAAYKSWVVTRDERESGERALLNLGHTVGHAIEAATGYERYLHGEAIALGLIAACRVSHRLGLCEPDLEERVRVTVERAGLDADLAPLLTDDVIARVGVDKKRTGSRLRFVTLAGVGRPAVTEIDLGELSTILRAENSV